MKALASDDLMLFQKRDSGLVFPLWAEIEIAMLAGCRPAHRFTICPPRPAWHFVSHFAVVAFIAMIFSKVTHGLSKNLCADARSLAGDYGKRKTELTFIFELASRSYLLAGGFNGASMAWLGGRT